MEFLIKVCMLDIFYLFHTRLVECLPDNDVLVVTGSDGADQQTSHNHHQQQQQQELHISMAMEVVGSLT